MSKDEHVLCCAGTATPKAVARYDKVTESWHVCSVMDVHSLGVAEAWRMVINCARRKSEFTGFKHGRSFTDGDQYCMQQ
jgi:hypothetical protein